MSNKSEKNMADFDDEDSPCEEELVQLAARAHCLAFNLPRARSSSNRDGSSSEQGSSCKSERRSSGNKTSSDSTVVKEPSVTGVFKISEVCQPGNTLLWDLLQDDKIVSKNWFFQNKPIFINVSIINRGNLVIL